MRLYFYCIFLGDKKCKPTSITGLGSQKVFHIYNKDLYAAVSVTKFSFFEKSEENIFVRKAKTKEDFEKVFSVRWEGYKRYFSSRHGVIDRFDFSTNTTLLIAEDEYYNPVGTIRIMDRRYGKIELDNYLDINSILSDHEKPCIHVNRFSIPRNPNSSLIKLLLWKGILIYCMRNQIDTILKSVRPAAARLYRSLQFQKVEPLGIYHHPLLGNLEHHTYKVSISRKRKILKEENPVLYNFFFKEYHLNIDIYDPCQNIH